MKGKIFFITSLLKIVKKNKFLEYKGIEYYLFGSSMSSNKPNDIDILLIYDSKKTDYQKISNLRKSLYEEVSRELNKPAHICLLTTTEEEELNFISHEKCVKFHES